MFFKEFLVGKVFLKLESAPVNSHLLYKDGLFWKLRTASDATKRALLTFYFLKGNPRVHFQQD